MPLSSRLLALLARWPLLPVALLGVPIAIGHAAGLQALEDLLGW